MCLVHIKPNIIKYYVVNTELVKKFKAKFNYKSLSINKNKIILNSHSDFLTLY